MVGTGRREPLSKALAGGPPCRMAASADGRSWATPQARPECTPIAAVPPCLDDWAGVDCLSLSQRFRLSAWHPRLLQPGLPKLWRGLYQVSMIGTYRSEEGSAAPSWRTPGSPA